MNALQQISVSTSKVERSLLTVSDIQWNSQQRKISIGRRAIGLTPSEYSLLFPLRHGSPVTYAQLAKIAYGYTLDSKVRVMMDKHIDRVRGKMEGSGIYVYCVLGYGYMLLPTTSLEQPAQVAS
jgi:DNA-binding response OmpR family regulator